MYLPTEKNWYLHSEECPYDHFMASINNGMTSPKIYHDPTTVTENLSGFLISDLLPITIFAKYFLH